MVWDLIYLGLLTTHYGNYLANTFSLVSVVIGSSVCISHLLGHEWKGSQVARSLGDENDHHGCKALNQVLG